MKNVLFPMELHQNPIQALQQTVSFLKEMGRSFHVFLLKTYMVPAPFVKEIIETHDELQKDSNTELQKNIKIAQTCAENAPLTFTPILQMGKIHNVVARIVKEKKIDYLILGPTLFCSESTDRSSLLGRPPCATLILPTNSAT